MVADQVPPTAWARLNDYIVRVMETPFTNQYYAFEFDKMSGNATLKILGGTHRYVASTEAAGKEGCAREGLSRSLLHRILQEARVSRGKQAELGRLAAIYSNLTTLPSMEVIFPNHRPHHEQMLGISNATYNGPPPNIPSLLVPAPDSAIARLQDFIVDIYGDTANIFDEIEFAQSRPGAPWSMVLRGREYVSQEIFDDKELGRESAARAALQNGALAALLGDITVPQHIHAAALDLVANFTNASGLFPMPQVTPPPYANMRTDEPDGQSQPRARSRSRSRHRSYSVSRRHRSRSGSRRRSRSPRDSRQSRRHRSQSRSRRSRSRDRRSPQRERRRSRSQRRRSTSRSRAYDTETSSSSDNEAPRTDARSQDTHRSNVPASVARNGTEQSGASKTTRVLSSHAAAATMTEVSPKLLNSQLSTIFDLILSELDGSGTKVIDNPPPQLSRLDSGNREKANIIRRACALSQRVVNAKAALGPEVQLSDMVLLPKQWVQEVLVHLKDDEEPVE